MEKDIFPIKQRKITITSYTTNKLKRGFVGLYKNIFLFGAILLIIQLVNPSNESFAQTWLQDFPNRIPLTIKNNTGADAAANSAYNVTLTDKSLDFTKIKTDGSDVRFADESGNSLNFTKNFYDSTNTDIYSYDNVSREAWTRINTSSVVYYKGRTFVSYLGGTRDSNGAVVSSNEPYIAYYNHLTGTWSAPFKVDSTTTPGGTDPVLGYPDTHGGPVIHINDQGYLYIYYHTHVSDVFVRRTSNPIPASPYEPTDINNWLVCPSIPGQFTYPQIFPSVGNASDGKVHLLLMENYAFGDIGARRMVDYVSSDGAYSFARTFEFVSFNDDHHMSKIYPGRFWYQKDAISGDKIHIAWSVETAIAGNSFNENYGVTCTGGNKPTIPRNRRQNLYYGKYTLDGSMQDIDGNTQSFSLNKSMADLNYAIIKNAGIDQVQIDEPNIILNALGQPVITYNTATDSNGNITGQMRVKRWTGSAHTWSNSFSLGATRALYNIAGTYLDSTNNNIVAYVPTEDGANTRRGGAIKKWVSSDGGSSFALVDDVLNSGETARNGIKYGLYDPLVPSNYQQMFEDDRDSVFGKRMVNRMEVIFYEWAECGNELTRMYAFGKDAGDNYGPLKNSPVSVFTVTYPSVIKAGETAVIYIYYGNPGASYLGDRATGTTLYRPVLPGSAEYAPKLTVGVRKITDGNNIYGVSDGGYVTGANIANNISCGTGGSCVGQYQSGTDVALTANANEGYEFAFWEIYRAEDGFNPLGGTNLSGTYHNQDESTQSVTIKTYAGNPATIRMSDNWVVIAYFRPIPVLNVGIRLLDGTNIQNSWVGGSVSGTGAAADIGCNGGGECVGSYPKGTTFNITANPANGYEFAFWRIWQSDDIDNQLQTDAQDVSTSTITVTTAEGPTDTIYKHASNPHGVNMDRNWSIQAYFRAIPVGTNYTLTTVGNPANGGHVHGNLSTYSDGSTATLTANANSGYVFSNWSGDCSGTNATTSVVMSSDKACTANFSVVSPDHYTLNTSVSPANSGTVTGNASPYDAGATANLAAAANDGYVFSSWSGDCSGTNAANSVVMDANKACTANFTAFKYALTTSVLPVSSGTISGNTSPYNSGSTATLTATPASGYNFSYWSGACGGASRTATVTMDGNKSCVANFALIAPKNYTLTTSVNPSDGGTIAGNNSPYVSGSTAGLTANANDGYVFSSWSGNCSGANPNISIVMTSNKSCVANFRTIPDVNYTLSITKSGTGNGSITSLPAGISGATLTHDYASGTTVTLVATASAGSVFTGWSGSCSGTSVCAVSMSSAKSVTANFDTTASEQYKLTVTKAGSGAGSIVSYPSGIGNSVVSADFVKSALVSLNAVAAEGSYFLGWSGDCSGKSQCSVAMGSAKNVTATFAHYDIYLPDTNFTKNGAIVRFVGDLPSDLGGVNMNVIQSEKTTHAVPGGYTFLKVFDITATDQNSAAVSSGFNAYLTLISAGINKVGNYKVMYWNGTTWSEEGITNITTNLGNNTISFNTTHFTEFAVFVEANDTGGGDPAGTVTLPEAGNGNITIALNFLFAVMIFSLFKLFGYRNIYLHSVLK